MDTLIELIHKIGYIGIFAIVFFECGVPITFFLPGDSLLFVTGFLASIGFLSLPTVIAVVCIGAIFGYLFGYYVGYVLGEKIFNNEHSFLFNPKRLQYAKDFFDRYGTKTLFLGRFIPVVRTFAASIAGAVKMDYKKFVFITVTSALFWSCTMTLVGYYLGRILPRAERYLTPVILAVIFISILPTIIDYIRERKRRATQI